MSIDPRFIIDLKGKSFVMLGGLLDLGHQSGLKGISTEVVTELSDPQQDRWVVRAVGRFERGEGEQEWTAYGDASPGSSQMRGAYLRHAETRSIARMLRFATNVAMTALEELGGEESAGETNGHGHAQAPVRERVAAPVRDNAGAGVSAGRPARAAGSAAEPAPAEDAVCEWPACGRHLTQNNRLISQKNAARDLCPEHLTEFRKAKEQAATS